MQETEPPLPESQIPGLPRVVKHGDLRGMPYLSPSAAQTYLTCGARYGFRYIQGLKDPPSQNGTIGSAFHAGVAAAAQQWVDTGKAPASEVASRLGVAALREKWSSVHIPRGETPIPLADAEETVAGIAAVTWDAFLESGYTPERSEKVLIRKMGDFAYLGYPDLFGRSKDGKRAVIDFKSTARSPSKGAASRGHSLQILTYAAAEQSEGRRVDEAWVLYAVKTKTPKVVWSPVTLTPATVEWAERVYRDAARRIRSGDFEPNPMSAGFLCSSKYCSYWDNCVGAPKHEDDVAA